MTRWRSSCAQTQERCSHQVNDFLLGRPRTSRNNRSAMRWGGRGQSRRSRWFASCRWGGTAGRSGRGQGRGRAAERPGEAESCCGASSGGTAAGARRRWLPAGKAGEEEKAACPPGRSLAAAAAEPAVSGQDAGPAAAAREGAGAAVPGHAAGPAAPGGTARPAAGGDPPAQIGRAHV